MMPTAERLLRLYPQAWRERYGEEFLATVGQEPLNLQQVIDVVSGAIDARLSADVRRATGTCRVAPSGGGPMMLKSMLVCERPKARLGMRESLIGAGVMIGAGLLLSILPIAARRGGWPVTGELLTYLCIFGWWILSIPFWLMRGRPWQAQVVVMGVTLALFVASGYLASVT